MKLEFFDCNVQVGRFGAPIPEARTTTADLMARLAIAGITRALGFHSLSKELHPVEGNPAILREVEGHSIVPCWVALPHHTGEVAAPDETIDQMKTAGAKALRLFPRTHNYVISEWCLGDLLAAAEHNRVPLFVDASETGYDAIAAVLKSFPQLRLTLLQTSYRCDRMLYQLFERFAHLSIETGGYVVSGGIEAICSRFGPSRLVFGTGSPFFEPGAAVAAISYAQISDEGKKAISSGNLEKLLAWS